MDMDGVIADFVSKYKEMYGIDPSDAEREKRFKPLFDDFIKNQGFANLDVLPGSMTAIDMLRKLHIPTHILSSTANEEKYDAVSKQKMIWLQKHGITFNPIFVPGKKHKKEYAAPDKILIDDTKSVIDDWNAAGGIGILHKDWMTTLIELHKHI